MNYADRAVDYLESQNAWRYLPASEPASEPTAFAALALAAYGRREAADRARSWLCEAQTDEGGVGVRRAEPTPGWPTPLAVMAWNLATPALPRARQAAGLGMTEMPASAAPSTD